MKVEIRDDAVLIDGYVNAVERDSKVLRDASGSFIEKIKAGVFQRALDRAKRTSYDVKVLLNHDYDRELTSTRDTTTKIFEDSIGLRCRCEIRDAEVVQKARENKLVGWSFGFIPIKEAWTDKESDVQHREIRELELKEVSILDDTKIPAYNGTSIETRSEQIEDLIEVRMTNDEIEVEDLSTQEEDHSDDPLPFDNYEWENRYLATRV